jgi:hypothetical protein
MLRDDCGQCRGHRLQREAEPGWGKLVALLEVAIAPSPVEADDALP